MFNKLRLRIRALLLKSRMENELDEELQFHLEKEIEQNQVRVFFLQDRLCFRNRNRFAATFQLRLT